VGRGLRTQEKKGAGCSIMSYFLTYTMGDSEFPITATANNFKLTGLK
jgi:hypothetical protein